MATLQQLERALVNADKAGDTQAASVLASEITRLRAAQRPAEKPYNPTDDMGTTDRLLAGVGKAMTDFGRGVGQIIPTRRNGKWEPLVTREDIAEARERDAPLMNTTAGMVGNIGGNVAMLAPTALIPGAATIRGGSAIGALTGALAPSTSTGETLGNIALGGIAAPAANLAGRGVSATWQAGKALVDPLTDAGQQRIAAQTLQSFASDPTKAAANLRSARQLVPGSMPTMAQAADDVGLAQLERTLANNPETGKLLGDVYGAQRAARLSAIQGLAGTPAARQAAVDARKAAAAPLYQQATNAAYQVDDQLANLLQRPVIKQAMNRAKTIAENDGRAFQFMTGEAAKEQALSKVIGSDGKPFVMAAAKPSTQARQITGQGLQDLKMALDDMLVDPASGIVGKEAANVTKLRGQIVDWMESANPDFKAARQTFASKSTPINTMDVADALMKKLQPALARYGATTKEQASAYAQALEAAKETVKKATGINKPIDAVIDQQANDLLENIAKDLGRKVKAEDMGRAVGSNTAQNLAAQNLLRRTLGPTGLPESWAESGFLQTLLAPYSALNRAAGTEGKVLGLLADAAQNPQTAARLLEAQARQQTPGLLGRMAPLSPAIGGGLLLSSPSQ
jgi:hypothetical protein